MTYLRTAVKRFMREQSAPTSIEYAIMVALIAGVVVAAAAALGISTEALFQATVQALGAG